MDKLKLSPPWIVYYKQLEALFKGDPEVTVQFDNYKYIVKLYVTNTKKADALTKLLVPEVKFGNITVGVQVIPANALQQNYVALFQEAFKGNPAFKDIITRSDTLASDVGYVVFKKEVVQFFTDDLSDLNRVESTLYENIAREVFNAPGLYFCTDIE